MSATQQLMSLVDDNKHTMSENDYLKMCNLLKHIYDQQSTTPSNQLHICIEYVPGIRDIIMEEMGKLPLHNFIIKYTEDSEEFTMDTIEFILYDSMFSNLSLECLEKIVEKYGGNDVAMQKMKQHINEYDDFIDQSFNTRCKHFKTKMMAYHIIDKMIVEFDHIINPDTTIKIIDISELTLIYNELFD